MDQKALPHILIVEDHPNWKEEIKSLYQSLIDEKLCNSDILIATDADEAAAMLKRWKHDVALLSIDLNLGLQTPNGKRPGYNSISLLNEVALNREIQRNLAVVVITARACDINLKGYLEEEDFDVAQTLERWLEQRRPGASIVIDKKLLVDRMEDLDSEENVQRNMKFIREVLTKEKLKKLLENARPDRLPPEKQMEDARRIQERLIPRELPNVLHYDISADFKPAGEVGGDYYGFIPSDDAHIAFFLADVCGKGLPAALLGADLRASIIRDLGSCSPRVCLSRVNPHFFRSTDEVEYATVFCGVLNANTHQFTYANAGHGHAYCFREKQEPERLGAMGVPLGLYDPVPEVYEEKTISISQGDVIVVYSDGITEASDKSGQNRFGDERLMAVLKKESRAKDMGSFVSRIFSAVDHFAAGAPQYDDMMMVGLRRME